MIINITKLNCFKPLGYGLGFFDILLLERV